MFYERRLSAPVRSYEGHVLALCDDEGDPSRTGASPCGIGERGDSFISIMSGRVVVGIIVNQIQKRLTVKPKVPYVGPIAAHHSVRLFSHFSTVRSRSSLRLSRPLYGITLMKIPSVRGASWAGITEAVVQKTKCVYSGAEIDSGRKGRRDAFGVPGRACSGIRSRSPHFAHGLRPRNAPDARVRPLLSCAPRHCPHCHSPFPQQFFRNGFPLSLCEHEGRPSLWFPRRRALMLAQAFSVWFPRCIPSRPTRSLPSMQK